MEEEAERKKETRMEAWGRDDFSVYKMHKGETVEIQVKKIHSFPKKVQFGKVGIFLYHKSKN